jgi:hypothetical protein
MHYVKYFIQYKHCPNIRFNAVITIYHYSSWLSFRERTKNYEAVVFYGQRKENLFMASKF